MKICIYSSASNAIAKKYYDKVYSLANNLAKAGNTLVYGAGSGGLMGASGRGFKDGKAYVHGIIPKFFMEKDFECLFTDADKITYTKDMAERKKLMEDLCDAFIIAPGGSGTMEEFFEALTLKQLEQHKKPIIIYNIFGYYDKFLEFYEYMKSEKFINPECDKLFKVVKEEKEIFDYLSSYSIDDISWNKIKKEYNKKQDIN